VGHLIQPQRNALSDHSGCAVPGTGTRDIMEGAGTPEKHLSETFAETEGGGHPWSWQKKSACGNAADTFIKE